MSTEDVKRQVSFHERSPMGKGFYIFWFTIKTLSISLLISIILECLIIKYVYPEQGAQHSADLLVNEIGYLSNNFKSTVFMGASSTDVSIATSEMVFQWLVVGTGFAAFHQRYSAPIRSIESTTVKYIKSLYQAIQPYAMAIINVVQLFFVRLVVILMSMPAFLLISFVAVVDGLVQRDLRRYTGAIERSWVHHYTKSWLGGPIIVLPAMVYLALPMNAPPSLIFMPSFMFFGLMIFILITTYKKYI